MMENPLLHPAPHNESPKKPLDGPIYSHTAINPTILESAIKNSGKTFYWIAGLSVINSLVTIFGGGVFFIMGLAVTLIVDGFAKGISETLGGNSLVLTMGFLFALLFDAVFVFFGYFAIKGHRWAFIIGMILYSLDAILFLIFKDWLAAGFHAFFLWQLWAGLKAVTALHDLQHPQPSDFGIPPSAAM